jgi:hypothetical protein
MQHKFACNSKFYIQIKFSKITKSDVFIQPKFCIQTKNLTIQNPFFTSTFFACNPYFLLYKKIKSLISCAPPLPSVSIPHKGLACSPILVYNRWPLRIQVPLLRFPVVSERGSFLINKCAHGTGIIEALAGLNCPGFVGRFEKANWHETGGNCWILEKRKIIVFKNWEFKGV